MRARITTAALLSALALLGTACPFGSTQTYRAPDPSPPISHNGYYIEMPAKADSPGESLQGGAVVRMATNLPQATIVYVTSETLGTGYIHPRFLRVARGLLTLRLGASCGSPEVDMTRGFDVAVMVVPDQSQVFTGPTPACVTSDRCGGKQFQDEQILNILGRNFENLDGDQVTTINETRALVTSAHYAWPADACEIPNDIASGVPRACPTSTASINDDEGGANIRAVAGSVIGPLSQILLCDLYNYTTVRYQKANPWPQFRDRTRAWIRSRLPRARRDNYNFELTSKIVGQGPSTVGIANSPEWLEVDYFVRGKKVAHARIVASKWYLGYTKWDIDKLVLL